jgi:hypothetical protein
LFPDHNLITAEEILEQHANVDPEGKKEMAHRAIVSVWASNIRYFNPWLRPRRLKRSRNCWMKP